MITTAVPHLKNAFIYKQFGLQTKEFGKNAAEVLGLSRSVRLSIKWEGGSVFYCLGSL